MAGLPGVRPAGFDRGLLAEGPADLVQKLQLHVQSKEGCVRAIRDIIAYIPRP